MLLASTQRLYKITGYKTGPNTGFVSQSKPESGTRLTSALMTFKTELLSFLWHKNMMALRVFYLKLDNCPSMFGFASDNYDK